MAAPDTTFQFTKTALASIAPTSKRAWYRDTKTQGLALCVTPAGSKTFYVIRRVAGMGRKGNTEFLRLGTFPEDLTVERPSSRHGQERRTDRQRPLDALGNRAIRGTEPGQADQAKLEKRPAPL